MYADINLVTNKDSSSQSKSKLNKFRTISYLLLFIVTVISIFMFILNIRYSLNSVVQKQQSVKNDLSIYNDNIVKLIFLNLRLQDIKSIYSGRTNYQETLDAYLSALPPDITIDNFKIINNEFTFTVNSSSLLSLNDYLNSVLKISTAQGSADVELDSLNLQDSGYAMTLIITI